MTVKEAVESLRPQMQAKGWNGVRLAAGVAFTPIANGCASVC
jgi:hypothetical protein